LKITFRFPSSRAIFAMSMTSIGIVPPMSRMRGGYQDG
jgi:hypothetical protein